MTVFGAAYLKQPTDTKLHSPLGLSRSDWGPVGFTILATSFAWSTSILNPSDCQLSIWGSSDRPLSIWGPWHCQLTMTDPRLRPPWGLGLQSLDLPSSSLRRCGLSYGPLVCFWYVMCMLGFQTRRPRYTGPWFGS